MSLTYFHLQLSSSLRCFQSETEQACWMMHFPCQGNELGWGKGGWEWGWIVSKVFNLFIHLLEETMTSAMKASIFLSHFYYNINNNNDTGNL